MICFLVGVFKANGQSLKCLSTPQLSQNTNYYLFQSSQKKIFISSIDGLNVFDGQKVKVYNSAHSGLKDDNIQSTFYEDRKGRVWFTTYEGLHYFEPRGDSIVGKQLNDNKGKLVISDYKAFQQSGDTLFLKVSNDLVLFNMATEKVIDQQQVDIVNYHNLQYVNLAGNAKLICGFTDLKVIPLRGSTASKLSLAIPTSYLYQISEKLLAIGTTEGELLLLDVQSNSILSRKKVAEGTINGIVGYAAQQLIVASSSQMVLYDYAQQRVTAPLRLTDRVNNKELTNYIIPYLDKDRVLWIGCDGRGVYYSDLANVKFAHWLSSADCEIENNVIQLIEHRQKIYALTRSTGIYELDQSGQILRHAEFQLNGNVNFKAFSGVVLPDETLFFHDQVHFFTLDLRTGRIVQLPSKSGPIPSYLFKMSTTKEGNLVCTSTNEGLIELFPSKSYFHWKSFIPSVNNLQFTNYGLDQRGNLYLTLNEEKVQVYRNQDGNGYRLIAQIPNLKDIRAIYDDRKGNKVFCASKQGLYCIDFTTFKAEAIAPEEPELRQLIYSIEGDSLGNLWMGTNDGIIQYNILSKKVRKFGAKDGIQGLEFNTNSSMKLNNGYVLLAGVNGINAFDPIKVKSSKTVALVMLNELKVNDVVTNAFGDPNFLNTLTLPYYENTLSFSFHAIDYFDPQMPLLKYKLEGVDNDFVLLEGNEGFARYAKLKPDEYTLVIYGSNADGVWNNTPKKLRINILPPFWQTWWFRSLAVLVLCLLLYLSVKFYLAQQLAQKDLQLREQRLTIDKQLAVQTERDRIAAEMHDDLGGGLTSIKFLSQRVLRQIASDKDKSGIQKIVDQSGQLITNMSEIIWAMNSGFDSLESLLAYMRRFAFEFFEPTDIQLSFVVTKDLVDHQLTGQQRRNIFLVVKEALHNCAKHSAATIVVIETTQSNEQTLICIQDNGVGISPTGEPVGNGLENMRKRMVAIGGTLQIENSQGTKVTLGFQANP